MTVFQITLALLYAAAACGTGAALFVLADRQVRRGPVAVIGGVLWPLVLLLGAIVAAIVVTLTMLEDRP